MCKVVRTINSHRVQMPLFLVLFTTSRLPGFAREGGERKGGGGRGWREGGGGEVGGWEAREGPSLPPLTLRNITSNVER